jgi:glyoxylase-like metal-dependent hydrolase (beta-lactamase superfamily II)
MRSAVMAGWVVLLAACSAAPFGEAEVEGPYGIKGYRSQGSFFWVVPVDDGVVLVDTGDDAEGVLLKKAVDGRRVHAVLVTHGHDDHTAGAHTLTGARVLVGEGDIAPMRGQRPWRGAVQTVSRTLMPQREALELPPTLEGIADGFELRMGRDTFRAVALEGHTSGSMAYVFKDVLFGGDAAMAQNGRIAPAPAAFSDDPLMAQESVQLLHNVEFKYVLDGHNGRSDVGHEAL